MSALRLGESEGARSTRAVSESPVTQVRASETHRGTKISEYPQLKRPSSRARSSERKAIMRRSCSALATTIKRWATRWDRRGKQNR